jgi:hypothetical protein
MSSALARHRLPAAAAFAACVLVLPALPASAAQQAASSSYTYSYAGPAFGPGLGNVTISITTTAPLAAATAYTTLPAGAYGTIDVHAGANSFSLPLSTAELNTDANGNIAAWFIITDRNNFTNTTPYQGRDYQAYSLNSLSTAVPLPAGVTGHYANDQGTIIDFYTSCAGIAGCVLAGNGQPYVPRYGNHVVTGAGTWTLGVGTPGHPICPKHPGTPSRGGGTVTAEGPDYIVVNRATIAYDDCSVVHDAKPGTSKIGRTVTFAGVGNIGEASARQLTVK